MTLSILLSGVVGSRAYGLATEDSDVDIMGVYAAPTQRFFGLTPPVGGSNDTFVRHDPDEVIHEALKYCRLCLKGNPAVMELLWLPEDLYQVRTHLGIDLIEIRQHFLSAERVRDAYLGYATGQFRRLLSRGDGSFASDLRKRTEKHARHLLRLLHQGLDLYETGQLNVRVTDPERIMQFGRNVAEDPDIAKDALKIHENAFNRITSPLPAHANPDPIEAWLQKVRHAYLFDDNYSEVIGRFAPDG